jgi:hypothetical protein
MIATRTEIKAILNITGTIYDSIIDTLNPACESLFFQITNNYFITVTYYINKFSFEVSGGVWQIKDPDSLFITNDIIAKKNYLITGSKYNVGVVYVNEVSADTAKVTNTLTAETTDKYIEICLMNVPDAIKTIIAQMVWEEIQAKERTGISSESFHGLSVSYAGGMNHALRQKIGYYTNIK